MSRRALIEPSPPRQEKRYAPYCDLTIHYEGTSADIPVRVPDISTQGMFINTAKHFPEGSVLTIQFRLLRTDVLITARAEVRYCLPGVGVGVEFIDLSEDDQRAIRKEIPPRRR